MKKIYSAVVLSLLAMAGVQAQPAFYNAGSVTVEGTGLLYVNGDVEVTSAGSVTNNGVIEVKGNWKNDRTDGAVSSGASGERVVKFTAADGTDQTLSSTSGKLSFYNLETTNQYVLIANTFAAGPKSTADIVVSNNINFNTGGIAMFDKNLTLGLNGTISNASSVDNAYFSTGSFRKKIATGQASALHSFPYYRESWGYLPAEIRLNTAPVQADEIRVKFVPQANLGNVYHVGGCNGQNIMLNKMVTNFGYWEIDAVDGQGSPQNIDNVNGWGYDITLHPTANILTQMASTYGSDYYKLLRIPSHDVNGSQITFNPSTADWSGNVLNSGTYCDGRVNIASYNFNTGITAYALSKFSRFGGAGNEGGAELPIDLVSLTAMPIDNKFINVSWVTATEVENAGFDVQRSEDGIEFESIGFVQGAGNSTNELQYKLEDRSVVANKTYYYRLNQIDFDGDSKLTYTVSARLSAENVFVISDFIPNPTANNTKIEVNSSEEKKMNIAIFNTLGQLIQNNDQMINIGSTTIQFDLKDVADGTYYAVMTVGEEVFNKKLVVTK